MTKIDIEQSKNEDSMSIMSWRILPIADRIIEQRIKDQAKRYRPRPYEYDVFVAYSNKDREQVKGILEIFNSHDVNYYQDEHEIRGGERIGQSIKNGLKESRSLCLIFSPNTLNSEWAMAELGYFWGNNMEITVIILDQPYEGSDGQLLTSREVFEELKEAVPSFISDRKHIAASASPDIETYANDLFSSRSWNTRIINTDDEQTPL